MQAITIAPNGPVFDLPWIVAQELGFFADEGLAVTVPERDTTVPYPKELGEREKEQRFDHGQAQIFNACEWGCLRRVERAEHAGWMIAKRSSLLSVCLVVRPDLPIEWPEDLANRRIGVAWETGGHYMTLKMLDGFLRQEEITCLHAGRHRDRLAALLAGEIDATHFHEPFASLAEQAGCRIVAEAMFRGGEVVNDEIDAPTVRSLMRALRRAVAVIDADPATYHQRILDLERMPDLSVDRVRWERVRYVNPTPYTRAEFERARDWMQRWGMIGNDVQYEQLVNPELVAAVAG